MLNTTTFRKTEIPEIDNAVLNFAVPSKCIWIQKKSSNSTTSALVGQTLLNRSNISIKQKEELKYFLASNGWIFRVLKSKILRSVLLHRKAGSVSFGSVALRMIQPRQNLYEYDDECTSNNNIKGLFFKLLQRRIFVCEV